MTRAAYEQNCYELKGASLAAARLLAAEIEREVAVRQPRRDGNLGEIQRDWQDFYQALVMRLTHENPRLLTETGLNAPSTYVQGLIGGQYPRAYQEYPSIFLSPERPARYFMYVTRSVEGPSFVPKNAVRLTKAQQDAVGDLLFAGGWLGNAPLVSLPKRGVAVDEASPAVKSVIDALKSHHAAEPNTRRVFIAAGRSLQLVEEFRQREAAYQAAISSVFEQVKQAADALFTQMNAPVGDLYANLSYSESSRAGDISGISISIRSSRAGGQLVAGVPQSPAFHLGPASYGEKMVLLRRDTPEGHRLAAQIDQLPARPQIADIAELRANFDYQAQTFDGMLGVDGSAPQIHQLGAMTLLVYRADKAAQQNFCPPDAKPLPLGAFEWLAADEADRRQGDTPPPPPADLVPLLKSDAGRTPPKKPKM